MFFWWVNGHVRRSGGVNWVWVCCTQRRSWCWHPLCFFRFCLLGNINLHIWLPLLFFHTWEMRVLERQLTRANDPELELGVFMCFFSSPCFRNSFNEKVDKSFLPTCKLFLSQMPLLSDSRGIDTYLTIMQIGLTRENDPELEIFAPASSGCPCCEICNCTLASQGNLAALRWESSELRTNEREWPGTGERRQRRVCLSQRRGALCSLSNWCTQDCSLENIWWN